MSQIKIYGTRDHLDRIKGELSDVIHACVVDALSYPRDKRAHRFFSMDASDFYYPAGRTDRYTIIEVSMFAGRSIEAKKRLIGLLFERICKQFDMSPQDVEITIFETPRHNWGIRGVPGDELELNYCVNV
jgi:phenylpyruvate tautomerase PptA (4-oxalocrotonate tautomerase family)